MINHLNKNPIRPERIIILGGSGFIGINLQLHLEHVGMRCQNISEEKIDLTRSDAVEELSKIILLLHL